MDAQIRLLSDFSGPREPWMAGSRLGSPPGDADVGARVLAALMGLRERGRPSDEELDVYRDALRTLCRHYPTYCLQHRAELVDLITQLGTWSMRHFPDVAEDYIFSVYPPDRHAIDRWVETLHLSERGERNLRDAAFHANF